MQRIGLGLWLALVTACSDSSSPTGPQGGCHLTSLEIRSLQPASQHAFVMGTSKEFEALGTWLECTTQPELTASWSLSDSRVARLEGPNPYRYAEVSAAAPGSTMLTARFQGKSASDQLVVPAPAAIDGFRAVSVGGTTCGISTAGALYCWGPGGYLFPDDVTGRCLSGGCSPVPVYVPTSQTFDKISLTSQTACGLSGDQIWCWGDNRYGQAGNGTTEFLPSPTPVIGGVRFSSVTSGSTSTCGLDLSGAAYCWGDNGLGQLGDSTRDLRTSPVAVRGGLLFQSLSAGSYTTCGVSLDGRLFCWGRYDDGSGTRCSTRSGKSFGEEPCVLEPVPVQVDPRVGTSPAFRTVSVGGIACAIDVGGVVYCWGPNFNGETGVDLTDTNIPSPYPVAGGYRFESVSTGNHTCALTAQGEAYCWGFAWEADRFDRRPTPVPGGLRFRSVDVGPVACGVTQSAIAYCWGANHQGSLGDGSTTSSSTPVRVIGQPNR